jgi:4-amino-4-deoxychorismate lyase
MSSSADAPDGVLFNGLDVPEAASEEARRAFLSLVTDRGLHYGDGLFETIACRNGEPRFLGEHLERLALGCERLAIELGSRSALVDDVVRLTAGKARALVKVLVTRGPATARGYAPRGDERTSRIVLRYLWPAEDPRSAEEGVTVRIADLTLAENPRLAGLKHLNRLEQVLARAELKGSGLDEALLLSRSGCLVSGTMSNVFVVSGSRVATPRLDRCGVAGVMRRVVMRAAAASGVTIEEARITRQDLEAADEVFLTNVRIGIWPVRALGSRELGAGPLTRQLQRLIEPLLATAGAQRAGGAR